MILGAPIWLNEFLVYTIKLTINLLYLYIPIISIYLIYKLIILIGFSIKAKKNTFSIKSNIPMLYLSLSVVISLMLIIVYFKPQPVIPFNYNLYSVSINNTNIVSNKNKDKLAELKSILNEYSCRRDLKDGQISYNRDKAVEIDFITFIGKDKMKPIHIILGEKDHIRYSAGNTDFFYYIDDKENTLRDKLITFIDSMKH